MNFLLDTNVVSERMKLRPNPGVVAWLDDVDEDSAFLSVITITEVRFGVERLPVGHRKRLNDWLRADLVSRFESRLIPIDTAIADLCGILVARRAAARRPLEMRDAYIAATALAYDMTLVTRNTSDFVSTVPALLNPWS